MSTRKSISKRLRFEVLKRDRFTCQYCGEKPPKVPLEIDHIIPVSKGGKNEIQNLVVSCFDCNRGKSNVELTDVPHTLNDTIERKKIAHQQLKEYERLLKREKKFIDSQINMVEEVYSNQFDNYCFQEHFRMSVKKFIEMLGIESVINAMEIACSKIHYHEQKSLNYFCGICWTQIRESE